MAIKVEGIERTVMALHRTQERVPKYSMDKVRTFGRRMIKAAKEYAPVKEGYLEDSIRFLGEERNGSNRLSYEWGVDPDRLGPGYKLGQFRYDIKMEKGEFNQLGPKSLEKRSAGYEVGEMFILRAMWDYEDELIRALEDMEV